MNIQNKASVARSEAAPSVPPMTLRVVFLVMAISVVVLAQAPVALLAAQVIA
jgi:hypothetical protein